MLGDKFKYDNFSRDETAIGIANALQLLCMAKVAYKVCSSACNGLPLDAEANERLFKVIFLDVGLISTNLDLNHLKLANIDELILINSGNVCEQFIGQHLLYSLPQYIQPSLYYWAREHKSTNAEVDYVINVDNEIIPIEVKAGKSWPHAILALLFCGKKNATSGCVFSPDHQLSMMNQARLRTAQEPNIAWFHCHYTLLDR